MENEKALRNFLLYSYLGIIPEDIYNKNKPEYQKNNIDDFRDYCTKKVIIKAYSDATNEGAFNTLFKKGIPNIDELKALSDNAKKESAKLLFTELMNYDNKYNFDEWHNKLCKKIVDNYREVKVAEQKFFTYGNAQKWTNMTLKYLWLLGLLPNCIREEDLHIPVDSFIIDALWEDNSIYLPLKDEKTKRNSIYQQPSNYVKPWSQWNYEEDYKPFRESIRGKYTLVWENSEWIKKAEHRKNKSITKKDTM